MLKIVWVVKLKFRSGIWSKLQISHSFSLSLNYYCYICEK